MTSLPLAADALKPEQLDSDLLFCSVPSVTPQQCFGFDAARFASASRYDAANLIKTHEHTGDFKER